MRHGGGAKLILDTWDVVFEIDRGPETSGETVVFW